jgi:hypothetical protein
MSADSSVKCDTWPERIAEERRWERYPDAHDIVTIEGEPEQHSAIVLNASPFGMGLKMASPTGLAKGQVVTIIGSSGPIQAVIRHITAAGVGALYVGVEWCE